MFSAAEIREHRRDAESMMIDTGRAWDPNGSAVNAVTGVPEKAFVTTTDVGKCWVRGTGNDNTREVVDVGGRQLVVMHGGLTRPFDSPLLDDGWEWRIEAVGSQSDPTLIGRRYRIIRPATAKTWLTARRYDVVEITWERNTPLTPEEEPVEIHVDTSQLDRYIADLKAARVKVRQALGDVTRTTAKDGNQAGKNFARVSAGRHGKRYPKAWTVERISATEYVYGPDASMPQGGMSFETGSRNQKPHLDGARSADLIEAVFGGRVERALGAVLDEALG